MKIQPKTLTLVLTILGAVGSYLLLNRAKVLQENTQESWDVCSSLFSITCDGTLLHSLSFQHGLPLSALGLVYFGLIGLILAITNGPLQKIATIIASFGFGVSLLLTYVLVFTDLVCPLCLFLHLVNALLWLTLIINHFRVNPTHKLKWGLVTAIVLMTGIVSEVYIVGNSEGLKTLNEMKQVLVTFQDEKPTVFLWEDNRQLKGDQNAPIELVIFSSFQCPGCKAINPGLKSLEKQYGEKLSIRFVHYPLSNNCNDTLQSNSQSRSCDAALASIAAGFQSKFWEYHDLIFNSDQRLDEEQLIEFAKQIGLDMEQWESDRYSEHAHKALAEDVNLGNKVQIKGTPTLYINGKRSPQNDGAFLHYAVSKIGSQY